MSAGPFAQSDDATTAFDVCALPLVRRLAALLDRDPAGLREGEPLPRGWHPMLFNAPTPQSQLRSDGAAELGVPLPDIGLPRLMMGGRQNRFTGDIPIGAHLRRESRRGEVQLKQGRSGRFALVKVEHRIFVDGAREPALTETLDYILRGANAPVAAVAQAGPQAALPPPPEGDAQSGKATFAQQTPRQAAASATTSSVAQQTPITRRTIVPDERLLFRYSAITDNPHRIHYDQAYAVTQEGYPGLVVNGSIPTLFLLEMFRAAAGREPAALSSRNLAAMFCGQPLHLGVSRDDEGWHLWAHDDRGQTTFDARAT